MDELAFLPATEQARLVREGEVSPVELVETYLERIERIDPELGAFVTVCAEQALADAREKADAPAETPFHGVPIALKDLDTTAGIRTTFSCRRVRGERPRLRPRPRREDARRRLRRPRQDEHAGVRHDRLHRLAAERTVPNAVGPGPQRGRLERRRGGGGRGRARRDRAGLRRRRLDSDSRLVLRALRDQGVARPRFERAVRPRDRARHRRAAGADDARRRRVPRLVTGYEWGDPFPAAPPERPYRRGGRRRSRPPAELHSRPRRRSRRRSIPPASPPPATPRNCSRRSATKSWRRRPTGAGQELMEDFLPVWQAIPALYPIGDPTELSALNQWYLERALATTSPVYAGAIGRLQLRARRIAAFWADYDLLLTPTLAMPPVPVGWDTEPEDPREQFDRAAPLHAVHGGVQRHRPAGRVVAVALDGRRAPDRGPARRAAARRSAPLPDLVAARGGTAVARPPTSARLTVRKKDVRDGVTAPRTSLWLGDLQTAAAAAT